VSSIDAFGNCFRKRLAAFPSSPGIDRQCSIRIAAERLSLTPFLKQAVQAVRPACIGGCIGTPPAATQNETELPWKL